MQTCSIEKTGAMVLLYYKFINFSELTQLVADAINFFNPLYGYSCSNQS
jgi:hypothetical protein